VALRPTVALMRVAARSADKRSFQALEWLVGTRRIGSGSAVAPIIPHGAAYRFLSAPCDYGSFAL